MKIKTAVERILNENVICIDKNYLGESVIDKHSVVSPKWLSKKVIERLGLSQTSDKASEVGK